ncbi:MAG TPA: hypothetical protein DET40_00425, partial [Lentisphaeria bacterium]|nr:hypothetical protein [Lentisphaeria bacterium]
VEWHRFSALRRVAPIFCELISKSVWLQQLQPAVCALYYIVKSAIFEKRYQLRLLTGEADGLS